ncbi:MAG: IS30 family transposase [Gemmatimonadota bacterium]
MATYTRLTEAEREEISRQLSQQRSLNAIARSLGRSSSTLSRELRRNASHRGSYRATTAQRRATARACQPRRGRRLDASPALQAYIFAQLRERWSPQQIACRLAMEYPDDPTMRVSHETIYTYLYVLPRGALRRELLQCLRQKRRQRRRRGRVHDRRGQIPDMISIEERPAEVADRTVPGHWEGDLLMGRRHASALGVLVERTSRTTLLVPLTRQTAPHVRRAFSREIKTLPQQLRRSLTYDRGKEMTEHRLFTRATQTKVYFAHPQSPWERGTCENTNGLIRDFFPKGTDFALVPRREIKHVQQLLNSRPRRTLDYRTPAEVFEEVLSHWS